MSGMMNKFYYGNAGKADYTPDQLPANRTSLFWETLRMHFGGMFGVNLVCVLAGLPALVWTFMNYQVLMNELMQTVTDAQAAATLTSTVYSYGITYFLILIPCLMIFSLFSPGIAYILRNWARDQHTFTLSDFWDAVKVDWKGGLVMGLLNGLSLLITFMAFMVYNNMAQSGNPMGYFFQTIIVILCCIWWMASMLIMPMMVTYDMSIGTVIKNSLIMVLGRLPLSVLIWGLSVAVPAVIFFFVPYGEVIAVLLYLVLGFALTHFLYASYANSCFDIYLNPRIEGAQVNMGLRDPAHAEEEIEVTDEDIKNL